MKPELFVGAFIMMLTSGCTSALLHSEADVDSLMGSLTREEKVPGIQYVVVTKDRTIKSKAAGFSDIKHQTRMKPDSLMMAYSMSKTFTAVAALQLAERGILDLGGSVKNYLPDIPYPDELKVRHLISQTSGIPNPIPLKWVHTPDEHLRYDSGADYRQLIGDNRELDFTPGEKYAYSNLSYWTLERLVEKITGVAFPEYMRNEVFSPLGLDPRKAGFEYSSASTPVKGYLGRYSLINLLKWTVTDRKLWGEYEKNWLNIKPHYLNSPGMGGVLVSADSVGLFLKDLLKEKPVLFKEDGMGKKWLFEVQKNNLGEDVPMTLGWHVGKSESGERFFYKEGGGAGFHCEMRIYPDEGIASVVMANSTAFNVKKFLNQADPVFLIKKLK
ncbi:MAG: beta-lactamase family protein [Deltaproteobacteria bacterium]|nr:beta-lactamase family protein [Deltaproteobacteria bacterium]